MPREDGLAAGIKTRFTSGYQPANRGRKPSKLKAWIKENDVSSDEFIALFKTIIASHTLDELELMVNEKNKGKLPVIVALCISAFLHDMRTGTLTAANSILDRIMGKPTQQINFGGSGALELPTDPKERATLAARLRRDIDLGGLGSIPDEESEKPKKPRAVKATATTKKTKE